MLLLLRRQVVQREYQSRYSN
uniref:Uncharacterized protein n=1 Tax=Arundo donax TaxID=35708 RepID=A0A0A9E3Q1_ARUDO